MIRIITDGTSDILSARARELDIDVLPLTVRFGDEVFIQEKEISNEEFYERLVASEQIPSTAQVNPYDFEKLFKKYLEAGDDILGIFISHYLSGTYQSAFLAKQNVGAHNIYLIDSYSISMGMELLVVEAARLRDQGASAQEIENGINELIPKVHYIAALDNLNYLKAGGRLSTPSATNGNVSGVYPIVNTIEGKLENLTQIHGKKACNQWLLKRLMETNVDTESLVGFNHSNRPERLCECMDYFIQNANFKNVIKGEIGPIIGTHFGAGAVGIAYFEK